MALQAEAKREPAPLEAAAATPATLKAMCMQCAAGAMTAVAGATGIRAWLASRGFSSLTPRRMRLATAALIGLALIGASVGISGT
jgi:hypothetical protein